MNTLRQFIVEANSTNSNNEKKDIIAKYPQLKKYWEYTYSPFKKYYVSPENLKKKADLCDRGVYTDIFAMLDDLAARTLSGHAAIGAVNGFIEDNKEYEEEINLILNRSLKTRADATLINKAFPGTVPQFKVALADKFDDKQAAKINFKKDKWRSSRKLDGVRCVAVVEDEGITFYSRTGNEFTTLDKVAEAINTEIDIPRPFVLDGEACIVDEKGNEDFTAIVKLIRKKNLTIENPKYKIFDILTLEEFQKESGDTPFFDRYEKYMQITSPSGILDPVEQIEVEDMDHLLDLQTHAIDSGWEGLIIRKNVPYRGKRTKDLLKVKKFFDAEYTIKDVVWGDFRIIDSETGLEKEEEMLASVIIEHKGNQVNVGSGFTIKERQEFYKDKSIIIGATITVQYFEESQDKDGKVSLRFPTKKALYLDGRDV